MNKSDMDNEKLLFSIRFNEALSKRGYAKTTLYDLKSLFEIAESQISNLRNANALPSIFTGKRICEKLKISFEWLLTGTGSMDGFQLNNADEIAVITRYRSLTRQGKRELIKASFNEPCSDYEVSPVKPTNRLNDKQAVLRLVAKD